MNIQSSRVWRRERRTIRGVKLILCVLLLPTVVSAQKYVKKTEKLLHDGVKREFVLVAPETVESPFSILRDLELCDESSCRCRSH